MGLNLGNTLNKTLTTKLIQEAIDTGDIFKEYMPAIAFSEPQEAEFKLSEKGEEITKGSLQLSKGDVDKMLKEPQKPLSIYNFTLEVGGNVLELKLDGKQLTDNKYKTAALVKGKSYDMVLDGDTESIGGEEEGSEEEGGEETESEIDGSEVFINIEDEQEFDDFNKNFEKLKNESKALKSLKLSRFAKNQNFRKALVLNLINSKLSNIKVNGEPIAVNLKKLNNSNLLEAPPKKGNNSKIPKGWENEIAKFFSELFTVYVTLNKCCKENEITQKIKTFLKNLYIITREGRSNYNNKEKRDKLFERIVDEMSEIINNLVDNLKFSNKKQQVESVIKEEEIKAQITFTNFEVDSKDIEDGIEDSILDSDEIEGEKGETPEEKEMRAKEIERRGFNLYGKDAGRLFPRLSFKFKDITNLWGLLGRGDMEGRQEKMKDKYGLYNLPGGENSSKTITNLPQYLVKFISDVSIKKNKEFVRLKNGDKLMMNYDEKDDVLIHKTSRKKGYTNQSLIYIEMKVKPEIGKDYESKIVKIVPLRGETFSTEPNYKVKFQILDAEKEKEEENKLKNK